MNIERNEIRGEEKLCLSVPLIFCLILWQFSRQELA